MSLVQMRGGCAAGQGMEAKGPAHVAAPEGLGSFPVHSYGGGRQLVAQGGACDQP